MSVLVDNFASRSKRRRPNTAWLSVFHRFPPNCRETVDNLWKTPGFSPTAFRGKCQHLVDKLWKSDAMSSASPFSSLFSPILAKSVPVKSASLLVLHKLSTTVDKLPIFPGRQESLLREPNIPNWIRRGCSVPSDAKPAPILISSPFCVYTWKRLEKL